MIAAIQIAIFSISLSIVIIITIMTTITIITIVIVDTYMQVDLACQSFDQQHTGEAVSEVLHYIISQKLRIAEELPKFAVSDNATNMKKGEKHKFIETDKSESIVNEKSEVVETV